VPYLVLGALCGVIGSLFSQGLMKFEHAWASIRCPMIIKPVFGALLLGLLGVLMIALFPAPIPHYRPTFFGNGYPVVEKLLSPGAYQGTVGDTAEGLGLAFLLAIVGCKLAGTALTLGSGGSGGLFAPSLFIGAASGGAFGVALRSAGLYSNVSPATYALAGMAGVLSGAVHCPLTAIVLVLEITHDYSVILPVMLVAIAGTTTAQLLRRESIYALALREMGLNTETMSDISVLRRIEISKIPLNPATVVQREEPVQRLVELAQQHAALDFAVCDQQGRYQGMLTAVDLRMALLQPEALPLMIAGDLTRTEIPTVAIDEMADAAMDRLSRHDVLSLAVVNGKGEVVGMLTRSRLMQAYEQFIKERL
jgi:CIC family chloride channel protein